jgi:hypothetical protein
LDRQLVNSESSPIRRVRKRSATIDFEEPQFASYEPDSQFRHSEANYPGVGFEVAYSQKAKDLLYLADKYILGSDEDICAVFSINLEYKETNKATLSVREPRIVRNIVREDELVAVQVIAHQVSLDDRCLLMYCTNMIK